jgi:hypothetical protein
MDLKRYKESQFKGKVEEVVKASDSIRNHKENPRDVSFSDVLQKKFNVTLDSFMSDLGIDPSTDTIKNLVSTPDVDVRWIIPEVFRTALMLGYRAAPIWPNITAAQEQMKGLNQVMPYINMSDAAPKYVGEGETIPLGTVSYGSKNFRIFKIGRGIKLTDEVVYYASLNLVSIFMRDFGVKLGHATDVLAIDCLINGEQSDGSESAPVIGVADSTEGLTYKDLLTIWVRLGRMGRTPGTLLGGEDVAIDTLDMTEFKTPVMGSPRETLVMKSPIPQKSEFYVHGNIPDDQAIILDPSGAVIKFNGWPLKLESERIVSNQTEAFYVTLQTGFAKLFRDAAVIVDRSIDFSGNGFPDWMEVDSAQNVVIG